MRCAFDASTVPQVEVWLFLFCAPAWFVLYPKYVQIIQAVFIIEYNEHSTCAHIRSLQFYTLNIFSPFFLTRIEKTPSPWPFQRGSKNFLCVLCMQLIFYERILSDDADFSSFHSLLQFFRVKNNNTVFAYGRLLRFIKVEDHCIRFLPLFHIISHLQMIYFDEQSAAEF